MKILLMPMILSLPFIHDYNTYGDDNSDNDNDDNTAVSNK